MADAGAAGRILNNLNGNAGLSGSNADLASPLEENHEAGKREVEMYIRTYQTLLRSSGEVGLKTLVNAHYNIDSILHPHARSSEPDMSAFIYTVLRLPIAVLQSSRILLGQSDEVFAQYGFPLDSWHAVTASARRRKWYFDGKNTLAAFIASVSDTDDIVPTLVALQIEWNKFHWLLNQDSTTLQLLESRVDRASPVYSEITKVVRERLHITIEDWRRLEVIWGDTLWPNLLAIGRNRKNFTLRMLGGSHVGFARATNKWWAPVNKLLGDMRLTGRPVYFVSSNTHSLANLLCGSVRRREDELTRWALSGGDPFLADEDAQDQRRPLPRKLAELPLLHRPRVSRAPAAARASRVAAPSRNKSAASIPSATATASRSTSR